MHVPSQHAGLSTADYDSHTHYEGVPSDAAALYALSNMVLKALDVEKLQKKKLGRARFLLFYFLHIVLKFSQLSISNSFLPLLKSERFLAQ